jgi:acyl carrier protein
MPSTDERLINCFSSVFPQLSPAEIPLASNTSVASWDSLATVTLISVIEEEFGVSFTIDDYDYVVSFELVRECLEGKTANA